MIIILPSSIAYGSTGIISRLSVETVLRMTTGADQQQPQWDESVVLEYEARVEPFTGLFIKDLLDPVFAAENQKKIDEGTDYRAPRFLDVGCGAGIGSLLAAENGFQVTATDVSQGMVDRTKKRALDRGCASAIDCLVADGQNLADAPQIPGDHYDYALAAFSLIFFPDPAKGLSEIHHCLSEEGKVLLSAWGNTEETPAFQIFRDAFQEVGGSNAAATPNRITASPSVLKSMLEAAQFKDVEIVGPVSHNVHVASPQAYFDRFALTSPKIRDSLEALDAHDRQAVKARVLVLAEERGGGRLDGSISIPSMAYFAYGRKSSSI